MYHIKKIRHHYENAYTQQEPEPQVSAYTPFHFPFTVPLRGVLVMLGHPNKQKEISSLYN